MNFVVARVVVCFTAIAVFLSCLALAILTFNANIRLSVLSVLQGLYETQRQYSVRRFLVDPDFSFIVPRLKQQLETVRKLGSANSQLSGEFIESMTNVMANARTPNDYQILTPLLKRLVALEPRTYLPHLWLAEAYLMTEAFDTLAQIEHAINLMPSDDRAHRLALLFAAKKGDESSVRHICSRWATAKQGGMTTPARFGLFDGLTNRRLALQTNDPSGSSLTSTVYGLEFGSRKEYAFRFDGESATPAFSLWLAVFPGTTMKIHGLKFLTGSSWTTVDLDQFRILPSHGFVDEENKILFSHRGNQRIIFTPKTLGTVDPSEREQIAGITLDVTFDKLRLILNHRCLQTIEG